MAEEEVNIISHLLEVEQNAYLQAKTAQEPIHIQPDL